MCIRKFNVIMNIRGKSIFFNKIFSFLTQHYLQTTMSGTKGQKKYTKENSLKFYKKKKRKYNEEPIEVIWKLEYRLVSLEAPQQRAAIIFTLSFQSHVVSGVL